jgi:hypothetical protein
MQVALRLSAQRSMIPCDFHASQGLDYFLMASLDAAPLFDTP